MVGPASTRREPILSPIMNTCIMSHLRVSSASSDGRKGNIELDSHADSPVVGKGAMEVRDTGRRVLVGGFSDALGKPLRCRVIDALLAYDDEYSNETYLLMIRNAISVPEMDHHLLPPFMMRLAGISVDECPKFLAKNPSAENHSIYFPELKLRIPLCLNGLFSCIPTREVRRDELEVLEENQLELTPMVDEWNPYDGNWENIEHEMLNYKGE